MTLAQPNKLRIALPLDRLAELCRRWKVDRLEVFGSSLRDDFAGDSDIDLLYRFAPSAKVGLFELVHLRDELAALLGRSVDLVSRDAVERSRNWIRRRNILDAAETIYEQ